MKYTSIMFAMLFYALSKLSAPPEITDEDILPLFERYHTYEKYTMYDSDAMRTDPKSGIVLENNAYFKVTDEAYDTWDEWTAFYESIFTEDLAAELMEREELYKNVGGYTYCAPGAMGWEFSDMHTYQITEQQGEEAVVVIYRKTFDFDLEQRVDKAFPYRLRYTDDGWRIASLLPSDS